MADTNQNGMVFRNDHTLVNAGKIKLCRLPSAVLSMAVEASAKIVAAASAEYVAFFHHS